MYLPFLPPVQMAWFSSWSTDYNFQVLYRHVVYNYLHWCIYFMTIKSKWSMLSSDDHNTLVHCLCSHFHKRCPSVKIHVNPVNSHDCKMSFIVEFQLVQQAADGKAHKQKPAVYSCREESGDTKGWLRPAPWEPGHFFLLEDVKTMLNTIPSHHFLIFPGNCHQKVYSINVNLLQDFLCCS